MRRTQLRLLMLAFLLMIALVAAGSYVPGGKLLALQQTTTGSGSTGSGSNTDSNYHNGYNNGQGVNGTDSNYNNSNTNPQGTNPNTYSGQNNRSGLNENSGQNNGATSDQNATGTTPSGVQPGMGATQAGSDTARASAPWGWMIGSFIVGLIIGGIAFSGRKDYRDRNDFRRAA